MSWPLAFLLSVAIIAGLSFVGLCIFATAVYLGAKKLGATGELPTLKRQEGK